MQKYPPTYKMWDPPKYPFRYPPEYPKNKKIVFLGVFFWYFRGIFSISGVGGIRTSGWHFWPILGFVGFVLCSWLVGCQLLGLVGLQFSKRNVWIRMLLEDMSSEEIGVAHKEVLLYKMFSGRVCSQNTLQWHFLSLILLVNFDNEIV